MRPKGSHRSREHHRTFEAVRGNAGDAECEIIDCNVRERQCLALPSIARMRPGRLGRVAPINAVSARRGTARRQKTGVPPAGEPRDAVHDSWVSDVTAPSILTFVGGGGAEAMDAAASA